MYLKYYQELLDSNQIPEFLNKYLLCPSLLRLKKIGYFCGMDYASSDVYQFAENISRYDHSVTVSLLVYKLTHNKLYTIAGLLHDIATPTFSHVIDYMNEDYELQESTEKNTEKIILADKDLIECFKIDHINVSDIINFKNYSVVDSERPFLCADRLDGIILTSIGWTKNITKKDIYEIVNDIIVLQNETDKLEIAFQTEKIALKVFELSQTIDKYCHTNYDNYMMQLLANITKLAINEGYITYDLLYQYNEEELISILANIKDNEIVNLFRKFKTIKLNDIPNISLPNIKKRNINPLVKNKRLIKY